MRKFPDSFCHTFPSGEKAVGDDADVVVALHEPATFARAALQVGAVQEDGLEAVGEIVVPRVEIDDRPQLLFADKAVILLLAAAYDHLAHGHALQGVGGRSVGVDLVGHHVAAVGQPQIFVQRQSLGHQQLYLVGIPLLELPQLLVQQAYTLVGRRIWLDGHQHPQGTVRRDGAVGEAPRVDADADVVQPVAEDRLPHLVIFVKSRDGAVHLLVERVGPYLVDRQQPGVDGVGAMQGELRLAPVEAILGILQNVAGEHRLGIIVVGGAVAQEDGPVVALQAVEEIAQAPGAQAQEVGVDELHHVVSPEPLNDAADIVQVFHRAHEAGLAVQGDVAVGVHERGAVADHRALVATAPQLLRQAGVEARVVAYEEYLHDCKVSENS